MSRHRERARAAAARRRAGHRVFIGKGLSRREALRACGRHLVNRDFRGFRYNPRSGWAQLT